MKLVSIECWTISTHIKTPVHEILHRVLAGDGIKRVIYLDVSGENTLERLQIEGLST